MKQTIKTAVVGCGAISVNHFKALQNLEHVQLTAVCDTDAQKLTKAAGEQLVAGYDDYQELLANPEIDVVHICTPHHLHAEMAIAALKAGKHVLCEKPMALNIEDAYAMQVQAHQSQKQLGICFQNRYNAASARIRQELDSGKYGKLKGGRAMVTWDRGGAYYTASPWRGKWATEGGSVLINQAIHTLDLLTWFGGDIAKVETSMTTKRLGDIIETEDTCDAVLTTADGARLLFYCSNCYVANTPVQLELIFENGSIKLLGNVLTLERNGTQNTEDFTSGFVHGKDYWGSGHGFLIEDFYRCLTEGADFPVGPEQALVITRLTEQMYQPFRGRRLNP